MRCRSHVSLLLEIRDEIFIFGGSGFECKVCQGGDIESEGKVRFMGLPLFREELNAYGATASEQAGLRCSGGSSLVTTALHVQTCAEEAEIGSDGGGICLGGSTCQRGNLSLVSLVLYNVGRAPRKGYAIVVEYNHTALIIA